MDDRERHESIHRHEVIQSGVQLLIKRAKLAAILLPIVFALKVIEWAWPNAIKQALMPLAKLVVALGFQLPSPSLLAIICAPFRY